MDEEQLAQLLPDFYPEENDTDGMRVTYGDPFILGGTIDKNEIQPHELAVE